MILSKSDFSVGDQEQTAMRLISALLLVQAQLVQAQLTMYVNATGGSDNGDGSIFNPFATLGRAQIAARSSLHNDLTISIGAGDYYNTSVTLTEADSPAAGKRVTWQGQPGSTIFGGALVTGWKPYQGHIWMTALPPQLIDAEGRALFRTLVQDERSVWQARTPNWGSGYLPCAGSDSSMSCGADVLPPDFDCQVVGEAGTNNATSACSVFTRAGYSSDIRAVTGVTFDNSTRAAHVAFMNPGSGSQGSFYISGALAFLDEPGEWAVEKGILYFWPYPVHGRQLHPDSFIITAPIVQRVFAFVGSSKNNPVSGLTLSGLRVIGSSMPATYIFMCRGNGAGASPEGMDCAGTGGPDTVDETNTSPRSASQGMIYLENATGIEVKDCMLRAAGIAGFWFEEANDNHTIAGNWVQDIAGFGLYANGIGVGDFRYQSPSDANVNKGHTIHNNLFVDGGRQIMYGTGVWLFQTGSTSITHNVIHRFPRDGVGFYGMLPFWTASPGGAVAPGMPAAVPGTRTPWGRYVTWNGGVLPDGNSSWSQWDVLMNKHNYLGWNDISNCNRQGLDGGVIESWGSSINNTWEFNAVHDNEGYAGLSLLFADDFTPALTMNANVIYENNCPTSSGANCADQNFSRVWEISPYRMPAANMEASFNILWNTTQRNDSPAEMVASKGGMSAYTSSCLKASWEGDLSPQNATLNELLGNGDGTNGQRTMRLQYGFTEKQLSWPVVSKCDHNFVNSKLVPYLMSSSCDLWDRNSIELHERPFSPIDEPSPWHSRSYKDYAIAHDSPLVTKHGFEGSFDVSAIGLTADFVFKNWEIEHKRRDAYAPIQAERYDRTSNLWTLQAHGLGTGTGTHFQKDQSYAVPPGSWARFDGIDFGEGGERLSVTAMAASRADGATIRFQLESPDASGKLLASVALPVGGAEFVLHKGAAGGVAPAGVRSVFMVFDHPPQPQPIKPDHQPHRYWRLVAAPADFNHSFYNANWDVCEIELFDTINASGRNLANDPRRAIQSQGDGSKAFDGIVNCTQWDGHMGALSDYWHPLNNEQDMQWVGYDFGIAQRVESVRLKQFPNQYCAATPSLQYSDDKVTWTTKIRMQCSFECPNNATGLDPQKGWVHSPGPGTVAPPIDSSTLSIGGLVNWFSFVR